MMYDTDCYLIRFTYHENIYIVIYQISIYLYIIYVHDLYEKTYCDKFQVLSEKVMEVTEKKHIQQYFLVTGKDTEKSLREKKHQKNTKGKNPTEFMTSKASPNSQGSRNRSGAKDDGRCHLPCGWPVGCCLCSWLSRRAWSKKT